MPITQHKIDVPYRSIDKNSIRDNAYLIQNCFFDDLGNIQGRFGSDEYFDFSDISSTYATKTAYHYWFQELQELIVVINGDVFSFTTLTGTYTKIGSSLLAANKKVTWTKIADNDNSNKSTLFMANGGVPVYYDGTTCALVTSNADYIADGGTIPSAVTHVASTDQILFVNDTANKTVAKYVAASHPFIWSIDAGDGYDVPAQAITDDISGLYQSGGLIWIQGRDSIEPIQNTGRTPPMIRVHRGLVETGTVNPYAIGTVNKTAFFMNSQREVMYLDGFNPVLVSQPYAARIQALSSTLDVDVDVQQGIGGKTFIIFNFKDASLSLVYDYTHKVNTGKDAWYEWGQWNETNQNYDPYKYRGFSYATSWNFHITAGFQDGKLYRMRTDKYSDAGTEINKEIITGVYGHPFMETKSSDMIFHTRRGDGITDDTYTKSYFYVQHRKNMNNAWSNRQKLDNGAIGESVLNNSAIQLGAYYTNQFRITHADDAPFVLLGIYENKKDMNI